MGTYVKIKYEKSQILEKGQAFLIGADRQFYIIDVNHNNRGKDSNH